MYRLSKDCHHNHFIAFSDEIETLFNIINRDIINTRIVDFEVYDTPTSDYIYKCVYTRIYRHKPETVVITIEVVDTIK